MGHNNLREAIMEAIAAYDAAQTETAEAERLAAEEAADWAVAEQLWDAGNEFYPNARPLSRCVKDTREQYLAMARTARNIYNPTTKEDK